MTTKFKILLIEIFVFVFVAVGAFSVKTTDVVNAASVREHVSIDRACSVCGGTQFLTFGMVVSGRVSTPTLRSTKVHDDWRLLRCQTCGTLRAEDDAILPPSIDEKPR